MGWKVYKVEKGVLNIVRGILTYIFRNILFPDIFPKDLEVSGFQLYFGDWPENGIQIMSQDSEEEVSMYVSVT